MFPFDMLLSIHLDNQNHNLLRNFLRGMDQEDIYMGQEVVEAVVEEVGVEEVAVEEVAVEEVDRQY